MHAIANVVGVEEATVEATITVSDVKLYSQYNLLTDMYSLFFFF